MYNKYTYTQVSYIMHFFISFNTKNAKLKLYLRIYSWMKLARYNTINEYYKNYTDAQLYIHIRITANIIE